MKLNETITSCVACKKELKAMEGRVLWDEGFFRTFCKFTCAEELLEARRQRKRKKKNAGITPMF